LKSLNPDKLYLEYRDGANEAEPKNGRRYTLTHSDLTADLFLTIGQEYAYDKISELRDEVLGEWRVGDGYAFLYISVYINGQADTGVSEMRNTIFRRELPLALRAIRYGDQVFYDLYPSLDKAPIWVYFASHNPDYARLENWGSMGEYRGPNLEPSIM